MRHLNSTGYVQQISELKRKSKNNKKAQPLCIPDFDNVSVY